MLPPAHLGPAELGFTLFAVLAVSGVTTAVLLGLALTAFTRRRSRSYLLVTLAVAALFARTAVAGVAAAELLTATQHHLMEHGLDVVMVALVVGAVYYARTVEREYGEGGRT